MEYDDFSDDSRIQIVSIESPHYKNKEYLEENKYSHFTLQ